MAMLDQLIAGLRCREVLADLSDFLDGGLTPDRRVQIEAHVTACDNCARFGQRFAGALQTLREELGGASPLDAALAARLRERLRRERP